VFFFHLPSIILTSSSSNLSTPLSYFFVPFLSPLRRQKSGRWWLSSAVLYSVGKSKQTTYITPLKFEPRVSLVSFCSQNVSWPEGTMSPPVISCRWGASVVFLVRVETGRCSASRLAQWGILMVDSLVPDGIAGSVVSQ